MENISRNECLGYTTAAKKPSYLQKTANNWNAPFQCHPMGVCVHTCLSQETPQQKEM